MKTDLSPVEYLARVGFDDLALGAPDEHRAQRVRAGLLQSAEAIPDVLGVRWVRRITWPDRVRGLVPWAGQQSLSRIISARQKLLRAVSDDADLFQVKAPIVGASGLDPWSAPISMETGFSTSKLGMAIMCRPAIELLAIVGLESVPLVSFSWRDVGFVHAGDVWRFDVEKRDGSYSRWSSRLRVLTATAVALRDLTRLTEALGGYEAEERG